MSLFHGVNSIVTVSGLPLHWRTQLPERMRRKKIPNRDQETEFY
jgi:hypothetical protein